LTYYMSCLQNSGSDYGRFWDPGGERRLIWAYFVRLSGDWVPEWLGTGDFGDRKAQVSA